MGMGLSKQFSSVVAILSLVEAYLYCIQVLEPYLHINILHMLTMSLLGTWEYPSNMITWYIPITGTGPLHSGAPQVRDQNEKEKVSVEETCSLL